MSNIIDEIKELILTDEDKQKLLNSSAYALPANPTEKGWGAEAIKNKLYVPSVLIYEWLLKTQNTLQDLAQDSNDTYVSDLSLELDQETYVLTIKALNKDGKALATKSVDFPNELSVVSITYDKDTKNLIYTLRDGSTTSVSLQAIYDYIDSETTRAKAKEEELKNWTDSEVSRLEIEIDTLDKTDSSIKETIKKEYPTHLSLELNHSTYVLTMKLLNKENEVLSSGEVDFPTESSVTNIEYIESSKSLKFTLRNGNSTIVPLEAIISGLATEKYVNDKETALTKMITAVDTRVDNLEDAFNWYINDDGYLVVKLDSYVNDDGYLVIA